MLKGGYPFSILLGSIIFLLLFVYAFRFRKSSGAIYFIIAMLLLAVQGFASIYELLAVHLEDKLFWRNIQQIPLYYCPMLLLGLIMAFLNINRKVINWTVGILSFILLFYSILIFTDSQHNLIRETVTLEAFGDTERIQIERTHLGFLFLTINNAMGLAGLILLVMNFRRVHGIQRTQLIILIVAFIAPFVFPEITSLFGWEITVAESMLPTGILLFYAIYIFKFLQVSPMAREKVLEHMNEGILIVDQQDQIIDANPAAHTIIQHLFGEESIKGTYLPDMLGSQPSLRSFYETVEQGDIEVESNGRYYAVRLIPIQVRNKRTGSLLIYTDISERKIYENQLIHRASKDGLTQLYNRQHFLEILESKMTKCRLDGEPISLLLLDLDDFKMINDHYGHLIGDYVLEYFAGLLREDIREPGLAGRIGGEEFAVVLPNATASMAQEIAEQLRLRVEQEPLWSAKLACHITFTISIGVAELVGPDTTFEEWYNLADTRLYVSKNSGKNRTTMMPSNAASK